MGLSEWVQLAGAALSGSALPWAAGFARRRLVKDPKIAAEARKLNAEASHVEWQTLRDEIKRLQDRADAQDERIAELEKLDHDRADREAGLEKDKRRLVLEVASLRNRVTQLEEIIKTKTTPEDMLAQLAELDRVTGKEGKR